MKLNQVTITDFIKNPELVSDKPPKVVAGRKLWTQKEKDFVVENWNRLPVEVIAKKLKRTVGSINACSNFLEIEKRGYYSWTEEDIRYLQDNHEEKSLVEIAKELDRVYDSVAKKARILGLKKQEIKYWNKEQLRVLKYMHRTGFPIKIIAHTLRKSISSVSNKIKNLNI